MPVRFYNVQYLPRLSTKAIYQGCYIVQHEPMIDLWLGGIWYAKFWPIQYFIDIDILQNCWYILAFWYVLLIYQTHKLLSIQYLIKMDISKNCRYIGLSLCLIDILNTPRVFDMPNSYWYNIYMDILKNCRYIRYVLSI